jgi:hypothetical protein
MPWALAHSRTSVALSPFADSTQVAGQGIPQLLGMPGVQVDLVLRAVQAEPDGSFGGTAIEVIDEQGLYLEPRTAGSFH